MIEKEDELMDNSFKERKEELSAYAKAHPIKKEERKAMRKAGLETFKRHKALLIVLCLCAAFLGSDFGNSLDSIRINIFNKNNTSSEVYGMRPSYGDTSYFEVASENIQNQQGVVGSIGGVVSELYEGGEQAGEEEANKREEAQREKNFRIGGVQLGHKKGEIAKALNYFNSGKFITVMFRMSRGLVKNHNAALLIVILFVLFINFAVWSLINNTFSVIHRRIVLESRNYDNVIMYRWLFLLKNRQWFRAAWTMLVLFVYLNLWSLTIIAIPIKMAEYFMVPYIVAENPKLKANEAITMSRQMMYGHKWELVKFELAFIPWMLLSGLTFGLAGIFFTNPYMSAANAEYAAYIRKTAKETLIENVDKLDDTYLYEKPSQEVLDNKYKDIVAALDVDRDYVDKRGRVHRFFADNFGILFKMTPEEEAHQEYTSRRIKYHIIKQELEGKAYPRRLANIKPPKGNREMHEVRYARAYTIWSLIMIFFIMSFIGWAWEVGLHIVMDGTFVNRGCNHGPWLPIYGSGCIMILVALYRFRSKPVLEFISAIVLCGLVEYSTSYYLEATKGMKWWDYSGYFLNFNGRICMEGLIVFGLGGIAMVYFIAPVINDKLRFLNNKVLIALCLALCIAFGCDIAYSSKHPNVGKGITDYDQKTTSCLEVDYDTCSERLEGIC